MKKSYLLDTCICVFIMRGKYHIDRFLKEVGIENCYISEITVAELLYGAYWSKEEANIHLTERFISSLEVIPIYGSLREYAQQKTRLRMKGISIDDFDLLIGCNAIVNDLILVTDNVKHFERLPLKIVNWVQR